MMKYLLVSLLFFVFMLAYFKIAGKYNIIDKPNHRSSHTDITIRGGGIVFIFTFLLFLITKIPQDQNYLIFGFGLLLISVISFIDDVIELSSKIRIVFHIIAVTFLLLFLNAFVLLPIWVIPILYVLIIGIINAYNFMDGINGISGLYSLVVLGTLWYVNQNILSFVERDFIIYPLLASVVFLFFNFRKKAKCFLGDIGSMGIAFWIIALLGLLILETGQIKWILLLTVYGIDSIITIIERIRLKENIFDAHRRHLYQLFANEMKVSHLYISMGYAGFQLLINLIVINSNWSDFIVFTVVSLPIIVFYVLIKIFIRKQIAIKA